MLVHRLEHPHQFRKKVYVILHGYLNAIAIPSSIASHCVGIWAAYSIANSISLLFLRIFTVQ
jgi:hypothetical protein